MGNVALSKRKGKQDAAIDEMVAILHRIAGRKSAEKAIGKARKRKTMAMIEGATDVAKRKAGKLILADAVRRAKEPEPKKKRGRSGKGQGVESTLVENPYGHGFDKLERSVDTIKVLASKGKLDEREVQAAEMYRAAFDTVRSGIGGALDPDKTGGGSVHGRPPEEAKLIAAQVLNSADRILGVVLRVVVEEIVGMGRTIKDAARVMAREGTKASTRDEDMLGRLLRAGLTALADEWVPQRRQGIRVHRADGAKPTDTGESHRRMVPKGEGAHVTSHKIFGGKPTPVAKRT